MLEKLAKGAFVDTARIRRYPWFFVVLYVGAIVWLVANTGPDGIDPLGRPLGTDFSKVYSAGTLVAEGRPEHVYDPSLHYEKQQEIFSDEVGYYSWHYPPMYLAVAGLLAHLPYVAALAVWMLATFLFYIWALYRLLPRRETLLVAAAFPATLVCLGHGQNAFFTTGLLALTFGHLDRRPGTAGGLLGLLTYKPHFGTLFPPALLLARRWKAFVSATVVALVLAGTTLAFWGVDVWVAFLENTTFAREVVLESGATGWHKIQTVFSAVRMWGGPVWLAYSCQGASALGAAALVASMWWDDEVALEPKASALVVGSLLVTPYFLDYDLVVLAVPIALMARLGLRQRFLPYERVMLLALWVLPLVARIAGYASVPITPLVSWAFLVMVHRGRHAR